METTTDKNGLPEGITNCPNCGRHCPIDQVSCGRGEAFVEKLKKGEIDPAQLSTQPEGQDHRHGEGRHGPHGDHGCHGHDHPHGEHDHHGHHGDHDHHGPHGEHGHHGEGRQPETQTPDDHSTEA